jgi:hypothetical protein
MAPDAILEGLRSQWEHAERLLQGEGLYLTQGGKRRNAARVRFFCARNGVPM